MNIQGLALASNLVLSLDKVEAKHKKPKILKWP